MRKLGPDYTPFEAIGGEDKIRALVEDFYDAMSDHEPALAKLHPCDPDGRVDQNSRDRFALFLVGWLGGPQHYTERHGHPRLRMRHAAWQIGERERDAWLTHMLAALAQLELPDSEREQLRDYLVGAAHSLVNAPG